MTRSVTRYARRRLLSLGGVAGLQVSLAGISLILIALLVTGAGLGGCRHQPTAGKPVIAVSIHPLASLVSQLTGGTDGFAEVVTLVLPGMGAHGQELTPGQILTLRQADLVVVVGLGLDQPIITAVQAAGKTPESLLRMSTLMGVRDDGTAPTHSHTHAHDRHAEPDPAPAPAPGHDEAEGEDHHQDEAHAHAHVGVEHDATPAPSESLAPLKSPLLAGTNPHLWLDPVRVEAFVTAMAEVLIARYPEHAQAVQSNREALLADIRAVHRDYTQATASFARHDLITFHEAFDPLAERYGLHVLMHLIELDLSPGGEVTPRAMQQAEQRIASHHLTTLYAEPQFDSPALTRIAQRTGTQVLTLDPLGNPNSPDTRTWQALMRSNLRTLQQGQGSP